MVRIQPHKIMSSGSAFDLNTNRTPQWNFNFFFAPQMPVYSNDTDYKAIFGLETSNNDIRQSRLSHYHIRGTAKDMELLKKYGASAVTNDANANAQFVEGDEDGEVHVRCEYDVHDDEDLELLCNGDPSKPGYILITDNTNGKKNTYKYRYLTPAEMESGQTRDGQPINRNQFKPGEKYYILESVIDENGQNLKSDHVEIYRLNYTVDDSTQTMSYDLIQEEGMDGSGESSIDYSKR